MLRASRKSPRFREPIRPIVAPNAMTRTARGTLWHRGERRSLVLALGIARVGG